MHQDAHLTERFWREALAAYNVLYDLCPTKAVVGKTPYEAYYKRKPNFAHLRAFGCKAYVHILKHTRRHLRPHSRLCTFIGYEVGMKAWKFYDTVTRKIFMSRDAHFLELQSASMPEQRKVVAPEERTIKKRTFKTTPNSRQQSCPF